MITMKNWFVNWVKWWMMRVRMQGMAHWRRVRERMMDRIRMVWSHMAVTYWRGMVEWKRKMMIMNGSCSLSSGDSIGTEGNYRVGEGVCVQSLIGEERVDLHLRAGCEAVEQHQS